MAGAFLAGSAFAGAAFAAAGAVFVAAGAAVFAFTAGAAAVASAFAGAAVFAFASEVLAFVFAFAFELADVTASDPSGLLERTETLPFNAGIARNSADNINVDAATIVTLDRTVAVPRGLKAELETLLVNRAPASVLPGCSNTAATRTMHERKNIPYKR